MSGTNSNNRVLVTGAAGFLGSHVARHCEVNGMQVIANDDLSGGFIENVPQNCRFVKGDVSNTDFTAHLFSEYGPFEVIYHLAAYAAEGLSHFIRNYNYRNNVLGSVNLINQAVVHGTRCFVFTSSIAVYGRAQLPMAESMIPQPEDPYGIAKYAIELDIKAAHEMFGIDYIIFRPHNVYGENQNIADRYRNVIGIFMNQMLQGKPMTVFGDGLQTRAFSYIDDVAPIIAKSPMVPAALNQVFNVGADIPFTVLDLGCEIARALGVAPEFKHLPPRNEVVHAFADHRKVQGVFSPPPPIDLPIGLKRMAAWVKSRGPCTPVSYSQIEVTKNMPESWLDGR